MKHLFILAGIFLISSSSFASSSSTQLNALGSAWKNYSSVRPAVNTNDITIVYGGADISRRPTLAPHLTTA